MKLSNPSVSVLPRRHLFILLLDRFTALITLNDNCEYNIDDKRSGRPVTITSSAVAITKELLNNDRRIIIKEIEAWTDCGFGTVFNIIHVQVDMRRVCARWIPKMVTDDQKRMRTESFQRILRRFQHKRSSFFVRVVNVDETHFRHNIFCWHRRQNVLGHTVRGDVTMVTMIYIRCESHEDR